jgi:hypothetical protein
MSDADSNQDETYSAEQTEARAEAALKRMLATPHKPHKAKAAEPIKSKNTSPNMRKL